MYLKVFLGRVIMHFMGRMGQILRPFLEMIISLKYFIQIKTRMEVELIVVRSLSCIIFQCEDNDNDNDDDVDDDDDHNLNQYIYK